MLKELKKALADDHENPFLQGHVEALESIELRKSACAAILPLQIRGEIVCDATGARVLRCSENGSCSQLWNEREIDKDAHFICPECGMLGQRMVELSSSAKNNL